MTSTVRPPGRRRTTGDQPSSPATPTSRSTTSCSSATARASWAHQQDGHSGHLDCRRRQRLTSADPLRLRHRQPAHGDGSAIEPLPSPGPALHRSRAYKRRRRGRADPPRSPGKPAPSTTRCGQGHDRLSPTALAPARKLSVQGSRLSVRETYGGLRYTKRAPGQPITHRTRSSPERSINAKLPARRALTGSLVNRTGVQS